MGLLGALGGLGQGLTQVGRDIHVRRERALEEARKEAEYQRRLADTRENKRMDQDFELGKTAAVEARRDARLEYTTKARQTEKQADRGWREKEADKKFGRDKELATLRANLARDNSKYAAELSDKLSQDDITRVEYGAPDANGYAEVIAVTKDGKLRPTGQKVYKPKLNYAPDDEEEDEDGETL
jgi:hypothetical protein